MGGLWCVVFCGEERNRVYSDCGAGGEAGVKFYKSNQNLHICCVCCNNNPITGGKYLCPNFMTITKGFLETIEKNSNRCFAEIS